MINLHVFLYFTDFFLVIGIQSHSIVVGEDACYDFNFF